jgi:hypothetical protein
MKNFVFIENSFFLNFLNKKLVFMKTSYKYCKIMKFVNGQKNHIYLKTLLLCEPAFLWKN